MKKSEELTDELRDQGFTEEDLGPIGEDLEENQKREKAVVFSP